MIKPTEYKSISTTDIKARVGTAIDSSTQTAAFATLTKLTELIKAKHAQKYQEVFQLQHLK